MQNIRFSFFIFYFFIMFCTTAFAFVSLFKENNIVKNSLLLLLSALKILIFFFRYFLKIFVCIFTLLFSGGHLKACRDRALLIFGLCQFLDISAKIYRFRSPCTSTHFCQGLSYPFIHITLCTVAIDSVKGTAKSLMRLHWPLLSHNSR